MAIVRFGEPVKAISNRLILTWVGILALAQVADLLTTALDIAHGGVEANLVAAGLLAAGGFPLLWAVKLTLVLGMGSAALLLDHQRRARRDLGIEVAHNVLWRGMQVCVAVLVITAIHNAAILPQLGS